MEYWDGDERRTKLARLSADEREALGDLLYDRGFRTNRPSNHYVDIGHDRYYAPEDLSGTEVQKLVRQLVGRLTRNRPPEPDEVSPSD